MRTFAPLVAVALLMLTACGSQTDDSTSAPAPAATYSDGTTATVVQVESANTFLAEIDGVRKSVRLVNTAAPVTTGVALSNNCLVEESTDALAKKLPEGSQVTLKFDENQRGGTGYLEAAVYSGDTFLNADMARAGMVTTTYATPADKFYPDISKAQQQAANEGLGLYSKDVECTVPAAIAQQIGAVEDAHGWQVAADDETRKNEREGVYQKASTLYNELTTQANSPAGWVGSIVTLDAVRQQLDDLEKALGDDYYPENGTSVNQQNKASAEATPVRPGS
ncbi:MAG: thermonuclease family protein [Rothia sp. (in: high G+C Gram-positive bacteria)]|nr:thermonuclease family protein [Rothia sp. (in: high G+C Gram-positive bacteria)]